MAEMTPTPRTDECIGDYPHGNAIESLARELERENIQLTNAIQEVRDILRPPGDNQRKIIEKLEYENRRLKRKNAELKKVAEAALEWIDAVPSDTVLPTMPGFDRDWADSVLANDTKPCPLPKSAKSSEPGENKEMLEEAAELWNLAVKTSIGSFNQELTVLQFHAESEKFRRRLVEIAGADTAMLDWLDAQGSHYGWKVQLPEDYPWVPHCVFVSRNLPEGHKTIREAIAARMKKD